MSRTSEVPDTPTSDLRRLADLERDLARGTRRADEDVFTPEGLRVNEVSAGALGLGLGSDPISDELARADAATLAAVGLDDEAGAFADVTPGLDLDGATDVFGSARSRTRLDQRTDVGARTDVLTDVDIRFDTRVDTRFDSRTDTRTDTRFDTRFDSRLDTRDGRDRRRDDDEQLAEELFGTEASENLFSSGIESSEQLLDDFGL
jgi:hypothetical protein